MNFKKAISVIVAGLLILGSLTGCSTEESVSNDKLKIVTTIFPTYDWAKGVLGDKIDDYEVTFLTDSGLELHSYTPSVEDIRKIVEADLFIYVGAQSDLWVDHTLEQVTNENQIRLNLVEIVEGELRAKEIKEGMQVVEDDCCEDDYFDEHVWMSIKNAMMISEQIQNALSEIDPENADIYETNGSEYIEKLGELDGVFRESLAGKDARAVVFPDRFPFLYLFADYDLEYYAAFASCSAESEVSFQTLTYLTQKLNELDSDYVLNVDRTNHDIAQSVISNSKNKNQEILYMSAMENVTEGDVNDGLTYISVMEKNLETLLVALGE